MSFRRKADLLFIPESLNFSSRIYCSLSSKWNSFRLVRVLFAISVTSFPVFGYKKTAVKCSVYNSLVSGLFSYFWIKLSMCYCSKSVDRGQGLAEKSGKKIKRGLGILPYGNFIIRTAGRNDEFCPCVRTWAVLAILVFRHSRRVWRFFWLSKYNVLATESACLFFEKS